MNVNKDLSVFFADEPPGQKTNAIRWLQKKVMKQALALDMEFATREEWERFRSGIRRDLPRAIGVPQLPPLRASFRRGCIRIGELVKCERVDVFVDEDYSIPSFVYSPLSLLESQMPAVVWSPGWQQDKFRTRVMR